MTKKEKMDEAISRLDALSEELLAVADDLSKLSKKAENEVRSAIGALEYAGVILYERLNK